MPALLTLNWRDMRGFMTCSMLRSMMPTTLARRRLQFLCLLTKHAYLE